MDEAPRMHTTAAEMVAQARSRIENLTPAQAREELRGDDAVLVDIREPGEREENGYIPGSVPLPRGMLEFYADPTSDYHRPEIDPSRRVILHCAAGGRSALAADTLRRMGYQRVAHLDGGFNAWKEAGERVEGGSAA